MEWLDDNAAHFLTTAGGQRKRVLELGAATGLLSIFLVRRGHVVVTSDCETDGEDVERNIAHNFGLNGLPAPPHLPHDWGAPLPAGAAGGFDLVIANDILIYTKAYPALITTLLALLALRPGALCRACPRASAVPVGFARIDQRGE